MLTLTSAVTGGAFALLAAGLASSPGRRWAMKWAVFAAALTGGPALLGWAVGYDLNDPSRRAEVLFQAGLFNLATLGGVVGLAWLEHAIRQASGGRQPVVREGAASESKDDGSGR